MSIFAILIDSQNKKYTFITTFSYLTHLRTALVCLLTVNSFAHGIIQLTLLPIACTVTLNTFLYLLYAFFNQLFHINNSFNDLLAQHSVKNIVSYLFTDSNIHINSTKFKHANI